MVKNEIKFLSENGLDIKLKSITDTYVILFDGAKILNRSQLYEALRNEFQLPDTNNWDAISDWLTDLPWVEERKICFVIRSFTDFLKDDLVSKKIFLDILLSEVLPWWQEDIKKHMIGGEIKSFDVFLTI